MSTILHSVRSIHELRVERAIQPAATGQAIRFVTAAVGAVLDGLTTYRHFEHLRSWGVPQEAALREALHVRSKDPNKQ